MSTFYTFGNLIIKAFNKEVDWDTDTIKVMLLDDTLAPDQDTHDYIDDLNANEVSGTGYTAGGATLASKTIGYTAGTNVTKFDAADVTWSSSTITARYAVLYVDTGTPATSVLIGYTDFGEDKSSENGNFTLTWDADGIFTTTAG
jgi:hypothetical protein